MKAARQPTISSGALRITRLGLTPYGEALSLQERLVEGRKTGHEPDTLLLLEHPPTITLGRNAKMEHVLQPADVLAALGVELERCDRGGEATYHGPGQLVAYPILDLEQNGRGVRAYVRDLEEVMIRTCEQFSLAAGRMPDRPGAWLEGGDDRPGWRKIGAVGVHVSRQVTKHGMSFNVAPKLAHYDLINPCGITDYRVTSLAAELPECPSMSAVMDVLASNFAEVFRATLIE